MADCGEIKPKVAPVVAEAAAGSSAPATAAAADDAMEKKLLDARKKAKLEQ